MIDTNYSNCNHTFIDLLNSINSLMWLNVRMCYIRATTMVQFTCLSAHYCFSSSISSKMTNYYCRISNITIIIYYNIAYSKIYIFTRKDLPSKRICVHNSKKRLFTVPFECIMHCQYCFPLLLGKLFEYLFQILFFLKGQGSSFHYRVFFYDQLSIVYVTCSNESFPFSRNFSTYK